jgi:hypothetical protein
MLINYVRLAPRAIGRILRSLNLGKGRRAYYFDKDLKPSLLKFLIRISLTLLAVIQYSSAFFKNSSLVFSSVRVNIIAVRFNLIFIYY